MKAMIKANRQTGTDMVSHRVQRDSSFLIPQAYSLQNTFMCINLNLALTQFSKGGMVGIVKGGKDLKEIYDVETAGLYDQLILR